jgi:hypothetical protein
MTSFMHAIESWVKKRTCNHQNEKSFGSAASLLHNHLTQFAFDLISYVSSKCGLFFVCFASTEYRNKLLGAFL